ncbi:hypothetical protein KCU65_g847, partial [Aureobasidium melanogenum]
MNINQWIESLEQAVPPNESPLPTDQPHAPLKRGRGSRTSSLLEPFTNQKKRSTKDKQPVVYVDSSSSDTSDATSISTSSRPTSQPSSSSSKRYRKRPRYHTKADKYHSKSESKPQQRREKKKKKKKEKGKEHSRRNKRKNEAVTGVVQTFKAKNVPKDRLTLDPGTKFGLYTKGRSSGPTRGKGLPDLVFSEMRFLQKPESSTKEEPDLKPKKNSQKKKGRQSTEREISRYFDVGTTRSGDENTGQRRHTPPLDTLRVARDVQTASPVVSDLLEKPFLGFGSRGSHPPTTTYYSWSESGKGSSARMAHFVQDLEPLAAGQLQSGRAQQQMEAVLLEQGTAQTRSAERTTPGLDSKSRNPMLEPAQAVNQATRLPVKLRNNQEVDTETILMPASEKHEKSVPAATPPINQSEREWHNANRTTQAEHEAIPAGLNDDERCHTQPTQPKPMDNPVVKQYKPWEELLQNCELAARPPVPTYYDEDLCQYNSPAVNRQRPLDTYNHVGHPLWRTEVDHFTEYDYPNNAPFMSEQVHWNQPVAMEHQHHIFPFSGETMDEASESLESEDDCELATEDAVEWDIDNAERYDEIQDSEIRDGETMDDFSEFWQPNKLY